MHTYKIFFQAEKVHTDTDKYDKYCKGHVINVSNNEPAESNGNDKCEIISRPDDEVLNFFQTLFIFLSLASTRTFICAIIRHKLLDSFYSPSCNFM